MPRLLLSIAALALAVGAHADPGGGKGKDGGGSGKGSGKHEQVGSGGGGGKSQGQTATPRNGGKARIDKPAGDADRPGVSARANDGQQMRANKADRRGPVGGQRGDARVDTADRGGPGHGVDRGGASDRVDADASARVRNPHARFGAPALAGQLIQGCPPGLALKNNGCEPPGLARQTQPPFFDRPDWWELGGLGDGRYAYYDGNLVRYGDDNRVLGYLPLLGGALAPGNVWPSFYEPVALPDYYQAYYGLGPDDSYRYHDGALYQVDPSTMAITSISALLTGDEIGVGQPLPVGYDVYNVPYSYRDRYVDGPDAFYRYSDGYVYQVDPETRLVSAAIELLT